MTDILLVSDGFFHPPHKARKYVRDVLVSIPGIQVTQVKHLNYLLKLDMTRFKVIVLYVHHKHIALDTMTALEQFVRGGGGLLAIHSATASFKEQPRYAKLIGGHFIGHGPVEPITMRPTAEDDEIFGDIGAFTVKDELYLHELQPDIHVHFETTYQGESTPMVWTRTVQNGRVCYVCPGHRAKTMQQPEMQEILRRGLKWTSGD